MSEIRQLAEGWATRAMQLGVAVVVVGVVMQVVGPWLLHWAGQENASEALLAVAVSALVTLAMAVVPVGAGVALFLGGLALRLSLNAVKSPLEGGRESGGAAHDSVSGGGSSSSP